MKFIVSSAELFSRLQTIGRVINSKNTLPALDCFLFDIHDKTLTITASDSETTLVTWMELIESGRFEELDIDDIWELINVLSASSEPQAFQALVKLQNSKLGQSLPQKNMQMQYIMEQNIQALNKVEKNFDLFALDKKGQPVHASVLPIFNWPNGRSMSLKETLLLITKNLPLAAL